MPAEHDISGYGLWGMVAIHAGIFIIFTLSFFKPRSRRDWRTFGFFTGFLVALFVEMYGFPLTIYLASGWLSRRVPGLDLFGHDAGHLRYTLLGLKGNPHFHPIHLLSNVAILMGFLLLAWAWKILFAAQREGRLATTGIYARVRHPQSAAFVVIMLGFLLQWPTILAPAMFPTLTGMDVRPARREEREARETFGPEWVAYASRTPSFFPRLFQPAPA